jgi:hypothetical protein
MTSSDSDHSHLLHWNRLIRPLGLGGIFSLKLSYRVLLRGVELAFRPASKPLISTLESASADGKGVGAGLFQQPARYLSVDAKGSPAICVSVIVA